MLLENERFCKGELTNDPEFGSNLASIAHIYVNACFLTAHRIDASSVGVAKFLRLSVAGFLIHKLCYFILFSAL